MSISFKITGNFFHFCFHLLFFCEIKYKKVLTGIFSSHVCIHVLGHFLENEVLNKKLEELNWFFKCWPLVACNNFGKVIQNDIVNVGHVSWTSWTIHWPVYLVLRMQCVQCKVLDWPSFNLYIIINCCITFTVVNVISIGQLWLLGIVNGISIGQLLDIHSVILIPIICQKFQILALCVIW